MLRRSIRSGAVQNLSTQIAKRLTPYRIGRPDVDFRYQIIGYARAAEGSKFPANFRSDASFNRFL
jgi:hypothetical protein